MQSFSNKRSLLRNDAFIIVVLTISAFLLRIHYINNTAIIAPLSGDAEQYVYYGYNLAKYATWAAPLEVARLL